MMQESKRNIQWSSIKQFKVGSRNVHIYAQNYKKKCLMMNGRQIPEGFPATAAAVAAAIRQAASKIRKKKNMTFGLLTINVILLLLLLLWAASRISRTIAMMSDSKTL